MSMSNNEHDERLAKSLSALIDDCCDPEELDFLLETEAKSWESRMKHYSLIGEVIRHGSSVEESQLPELDLVSSVRSALADEPAPVMAEPAVKDEPKADNVVSLPVVQKSRWQQALGGVAIAASVAMVVVFGGDFLLNGSASNQVAVQTPANLSTIKDIKAIQPASLESDNKRLQSYLRQHAEQSALTSGQGMMPMAKVVSYPTEK